MIDRRTILASLVALALLQACASDPQSLSANPVKSVADARLRADVMRTIGTHEFAAGGSRVPLLMSADPLAQDGDTTVERWVVDSNGKRVPYQVKLTPAPSGGLSFSIARLTK